MVQREEIRLEKFTRLGDIVLDFPLGGLFAV